MTHDTIRSLDVFSSSEWPVLEWSHLSRWPQKEGSKAEWELKHFSPYLHKNKPAPDEEGAQGTNIVNFKCNAQAELNLFPQMNQKVYTSLIILFINLEVLGASNIILQFATLMQMKEKDTWAGKRPQWAKRLAAKPENLGPIPNTHMAEGEKRLPQIALWPPQACWGMYLPTSLPATQPTYTHTYKTSSNFF